MSKGKQIEEFSKVICKACVPYTCCELKEPCAMSKREAEIYFNLGYRKASEVAREIFEEIENAHEECIHIDPSTNIGYLLQSKFELKLAELKKKYTESEKDDDNT